MQYRIQSKEKVWIDEAGNAIPHNRLTAGEKLREKATATIIKESLAAQKKLEDLKAKVEDLIQQVYQNSLAETNTTGENRKKGGFTFYNFDRTIKVEMDSQMRIEFDDLTLEACKEKLHDFISNGTNGVDDFMRELIMSAFETSRGRVDTKKVLNLKRYKSRTTDPLYHEAMDLLDKSIRYPGSKAYYRISVRDEDGKYQAVNLNFAAI